MSSSKLSNKICTTCHSLLNRHSALKKSFIENQQRLQGLLEVEDALKKESFRNENDEAANFDADKNVAAQEEQYTYIESIEPFDEEEWEAKPSEQDPCEEETISAPDFIFSVQREVSPLKKDSTVDTTKSLSVKSKKYRKKAIRAEVNVCEFCSKQFQLRSTFNRHVARHYNFNRFVCGKSLSQSASYLLPTDFILSFF